VAATLGDVIGGRMGPGMVLNYGLDRVRFITPVKAGARIRNRVSLQAIEPKADGKTLYTMACTMEIEGEQAPALVATVLGLATG
jgi:acyl dehydratase